MDGGCGHHNALNKHCHKSVSQMHTYDVYAPQSSLVTSEVQLMLYIVTRLSLIITELFVHGGEMRTIYGTVARATTSIH